MTKHEWKQTEPGVLVLSGTDFRVVYEPHSNGDFHLMNGPRSQFRFTILASAKSHAEYRQKELEEIGIPLVAKE